MDKYADPLDKASDLASMYNEQGLAEVQRKNAPEQTQNPDGTWPHTECVDCGDDIPEGRLQLGRVRCISCQDIKERRARAFKK